MDRCLRLRPGNLVSLCQPQQPDVWIYFGRWSPGTFGLSPQKVPRPGGHDSYLVDSASSHMLVSKIKPCMSKYKQLYGETANGSLNQLSFI